MSLSHVHDMGITRADTVLIWDRELYPINQSSDSAVFFKIRPVTCDVSKLHNFANTNTCISIVFMQVVMMLRSLAFLQDTGFLTEYLTEVLLAK